MLVAQPALMLRLVGSIVPLPRWTAPVVVAGFLISVIGYYATNRSTPAVLFLVGYFFVAEILAAALLIAEGRRRAGVSSGPTDDGRHRVPALRAVDPDLRARECRKGRSRSRRSRRSPSSPGSSHSSPGSGYLAAFVPPRWLREIGYRSLAFEVVRSIVSRPTGTDERVLWTALADAAGQILGILTGPDRGQPARRRSC